tara:strand:+ start:334 stop:792 length:459 start_codon:yes stop_codon:yes gene_type:complete
MKKFTLFLIVPLLFFSQNNDDIDTNAHVTGCIDLDETIIDIVSIFGDTSLLDGLLGCQELIPTLESGILSAFLPFDIPLDCNTDLTPFGYLDMNVSDVCECSCQKYLDIYKHNLTNRILIKKINILGKEAKTKGFNIEIYNDGSIEKKYIID